MNFDFLHCLDQGLKENKLIVANEAKHKLIQFLTLMIEWNRVFNLTAITTPKEMVYLHLIDSLLIQPYLKGSHFIDIGSGAGLPGIPLAIINPNSSWVLLDKNSKKTRFLIQVAALLDLKNVNIINDRSEDFQPEVRFDSIISRAFGNLSLFIDKTKHLLEADGIFVAMKGKYPKEELNDIPKRFIVTEVRKLEIKGMNIERHLVIMKSL